MILVTDICEVSDRGLQNRYIGIHSEFRWALRICGSVQGKSTFSVVNIKKLGPASDTPNSSQPYRGSNSPSTFLKVQLKPLMNKTLDHPERSGVSSENSSGSLHYGEYILPCSLNCAHRPTVPLPGE